MSWFTNQEKKVILFVFTVLFVGIFVSWYLKLHPLKKTYPLNPEEKKLLHKEPVNINTADFNDLINIPGIGPSLAESILEYRKNNGPFKETQELLLVKGIGQKKLKEFTRYISLK